MRRDELSDMVAFAAVAEASSFTRAAKGLGISASALSHAMRALEARLGVRLLARTTRSVSMTEAGERLYRTVQPALAEIGAGLEAVGRLRDRPSGTVRITAPKHAAVSMIWPMLPGFLAACPEVRVEIITEERLVDIVAERFDAGVRFGENVAGDMISVRVGRPIGVAVVGSPGYLAGRAAPETPEELAGHRCINARLGSGGGLYRWEFERAGQAIEMKVEGPLVFNDADLMLTAALAGEGLAYLFEDQVRPHVAAGRLVRVLEGWCRPFPGYCVYHPSRRQTPAALAAFIEALRVAGV